MHSFFMIGFPLMWSWIVLVSYFIFPISKLLCSLPLLVKSLRIVNILLWLSWPRLSCPISYLGTWVRAFTHLNITTPCYIGSLCFFALGFSQFLDKLLCFTCIKLSFFGLPETYFCVLRFLPLNLATFLILYGIYGSKACLRLALPSYSFLVLSSSDVELPLGTLSLPLCYLSAGWLNQTHFFITIDSGIYSYLPCC